MTSTATAQDRVNRTAAGLAKRVAVGEITAARAAFGVIALHVLDDNYLQPNPGTTGVDHAAGGLVQVLPFLLAALLYGRVRAGARATLALLGGLAGVVVGTEGAYYATSGGLSGDDYTGLLASAAGILLLGLGARTLWRSRRRGGAAWWRYSRRVLVAGGAFVIGYVVLFPAAGAYVLTHIARAGVPPAELGMPYESVEFTTSDGLRLRGWYIASRNGAAVIASPGRSHSVQARARLLAQHGYGVLLFDRRGEGESDGDPNIFGWEGERDLRGAVSYLQSRPDFSGRIGGIGLSVGGEMLIEAAAKTNALEAIVSEGASSRSLRDDLAYPGGTLDEIVGGGIVTAGVAVFTSDLPPASLKSLVPKISGATFFIYGQKGQSAEKPANTAFHAAARESTELWEVAGAGHISGLDAQPAEYERRVVAFFDRHLLRRNLQGSRIPRDGREPG